MGPLKENVKIKQNELETIKITKIKSRNIERKSWKTLELSSKGKEFNRHQAHVETKKEGVEIKRETYLTALSQRKVQEITDNQSKGQDDNDIRLEKMAEDKK